MLQYLNMFVAISVLTEKKILTIDLLIKKKTKYLRYSYGHDQTQIAAIERPIAASKLKMLL